MITVYGVYKSRASRIYWALEELSLAHDSVPVLQARYLADPKAADARLNTQSDSFLAINPVGLIPALKDGETVLTESLAITLYLARKYGANGLGPKDFAEEGEMLSLTLWAATEIEPHSVRAVLLADAGGTDSEEGKATLKAIARLLAKSFDILEKRLAGRDYLVGNRFTVADLNLAEVLRYAKAIPELFDTHPAVAAWLDRCQARPGFKAMWAKRIAEV